MKQAFILPLMLFYTQDLFTCSSGFTISKYHHGRTKFSRKIGTTDVSMTLLQNDDGGNDDEVKTTTRIPFTLIRPCKHWENKTDPEEYWFNGRIHTLGNTGFFGALHAAMGPVSTKLIDLLAYRGLDVRSQVAKELRHLIGRRDARVLDVCCGVGISTRALKDSFHDAETIIGIDTSPEMIEMAQMITVHDEDLDMVREGFVNNKNFLQKCSHRLRQAISTTRASTDGSSFGSRLRKAITTRATTESASLGDDSITFVQSNAESTPFPDESFDLVTVMYALHEVPNIGRSRIFNEAKRLLRRPGGILAIIDISREYKPSKSMLAGEPYVIEYQKNIHNQLQNVPGFNNTLFRNETVVPGHVEMWILTRNNDE